MLTSDSGPGREILRLYSPSEEVDYFESGDDYLSLSRLSSPDALSGEDSKLALYQYIGSYLKGGGGIYHAYVIKSLYRDSVSSVVVEAGDTVKICPVVNGRYSPVNDITGTLTDGSSGKLQVVGSDVCISYDESAGILNFAAQTTLAADATITT